ncbi:hypothetical protein QL285_071133 [Trifolium repens]|nr:hypothetical protein QL285_071133 [Trifolium repens]
MSVWGKSPYLSRFTILTQKLPKLDAALVPRTVQSPSCLLRIHEIGVPIGEIDSNTSRQGTILSMTHR